MIISQTTMEKCKPHLPQLKKAPIVSWNGLSFTKEAKKMNNIHTDIIKRFGRYPYRNKVLGRESTNQEAEYLNTTHHKFFKI